MKILHTTLVKGTLWTIGAFGLSQLLRVVSSIVLARLLTPEIFGAMLIIYSLGSGIDLISDVGIGQSIVSNKNAENPVFYNTAWSLRLARGLLLWIVCLAIALPLAQIYETPIIALILPVVGLAFVFSSLASLSIIFFQRRLETVKLSLIDFFIEIVSTLSQVTFAYFHPTIWALVFGVVFPTAIRSAASYVIMPKLRHRIYVSKKYAKQIFTFGKWIFLSSLIFFLSSNFDRLYLGKIIPLEILGIYAIARNLAEVLNSLFTRLNFVVIFPFMAAHADLPRSELGAQLRWLRATFLVVVAVGVSLLVASSDLLVGLLYDHRYQSAGWMLAILATGSWFSILCIVNESTLLGFGKPLYGAVANSLKFGWLLFGLPLAAVNYGFTAIIFVVALSDLWRYIPILIGQRRERFAFFAQDLSMTLSMFVLIGLWEWLRYLAGFGTSFSNFAGS